MADRVGQQLDNYRLLRLLGVGGFGEVYLAEHTHRKLQVAIKILPPLAQDDLGSFLTEARTFRLKHSNIVQVLDFGVEGRTPFIVMEYATGGTLRQRHPRGTRVPLPTIVSYVKQVASALQYAHDERLVHRDVKPENMLIGAQNQVLLSDFGIATIAHGTSSQSVETMAGTIPYMAPEQIQGHPRAASDQYSLAVVVYEWLCGDRPFQGTLTEVAVKNATVFPPPLHEKVPALSPDVEQVVMTALAKDPRQRFGSVLAFANALEQASQLKLVSEGSVDTPAQPYHMPLRSGKETPVSVIVPSPSLPYQQGSVPVAQSKLEAARQTIFEQPSRTPETPRPPQRGISRRLFVISGLTVLAGTGAFTAWKLFPWKNILPPPPTHPTSTPTPSSHLIYTYRGHSEWVDRVAWSQPDGKRIASSSKDATVQVWDATDGLHEYTYQGHSAEVATVAWSPDGKRIASAGFDRIVQVWDATTGTHLYTYRGHSNEIDTIVWSPKSTRIASASYDKTVQVWDASNGGNAYTYRGHSDLVTGVAWSPDGKRIASSGNDTTVQVWDAITGKTLYTYRGHFDVVGTVSWSPDSKFIASGSHDRTVQVWNATDGTRVYTYRHHSSDVFRVAWSLNGKRIASASKDHTVQVWDATSGGHQYIYTGHTDQVFAVAWSPDSKLIASAGADATVQVWAPP